MSQTDNSSRAYALAEQWIEIILSTNPELLVNKINTEKIIGDGKPSEFNFDSVLRSARGLAEFRQQLGNALCAQFFPEANSTVD